MTIGNDVTVQVTGKGLANARSIGSKLSLSLMGIAVTDVYAYLQMKQDAYIQNSGSFTAGNVTVESLIDSSSYDGKVNYGTANASGGQATNDDYKTEEEKRKEITLIGSDSVKTEAKTVSVNNAYLKGTGTNTMKAGKVKVFARSVTGADTHSSMPDEIAGIAFNNVSSNAYTNDSVHAYLSGVNLEAVRRSCGHHKRKERSGDRRHQGWH